MRLPTELRLKVLEMLLSSAMPIEPLWSNDCALAGLPQRSAQLLRACQQLYREGYLLLYDKNEVAI